jgi:hypothetical protein
MASGEALSRPSVGGGAAKRRERMMDGNFTIGRFGGVEVRLHWSLIAVFALIVWSLADGVLPSQNPGLSDGAYLGAAIVAALLFLASILLHCKPAHLRPQKEDLRAGLDEWLEYST